MRRTESKAAFTHSGLAPASQYYIKWLIQEKRTWSGCMLRKDTGQLAKIAPTEELPLNS